MPWTLITGGAKNLGAALSAQLAKSGKAIALHYRESNDNAINLVSQIQNSGGRAKSIFGDFSSVSSTEAFIQNYLETFEETETVIHNVGNYLIKSLSETPPLQLEDLFQTNVFASFRITQALLPTLKKNQGNLLFIGIAGLGSIKAETFSSAYHLTKLILHQMVKTLAKELAPANVRVNMISPGYLENAITPNEAKKKLPHKRAVRFEEVVQAVRFLCSKDATSITGQNIEVAGGVRL